MSDYAMMGGTTGNEALDRALKHQAAAQQARAYDQQTTLGGGIAAGLNVTKPVTLSATLGELNMLLQKLAELTSEVADRVRGPQPENESAAQLVGGPDAGDLNALASRLLRTADRIERNVMRAFNAL